MAKKRTKKKSIATQLKYEIYGILLITISVIALSGEAAVGRSLSKLFGLVFGKFYFVLALVGIYIGLYVMVKRTWPKAWTTKRTGMLLAVLALTLMSSISDINQRFDTRENLTGNIIFSQLSGSLNQELILAPVGPEVSIREKAISGGYVGALQYSMLYSLFGYYGAQLMMLVMFGISIMLITGKSYVDLVRLVRQQLRKIIKQLYAKWKMSKTRRQSVAAARTHAKRVAANQREEEEEDNEEEEDHEELVRKPRQPLLQLRSRASSLFPIKLDFISNKKKSDPDDEGEEERTANSYLDEEEATQDQQAFDTWHMDEDPDLARQAWQARGTENDLSTLQQENEHYNYEQNPSPVASGVLAGWQQPIDESDTNALTEHGDADQAIGASGDDGDYPPLRTAHPSELSEALVNDGDSEEQVPRRPIEGVKPLRKPYRLPSFSLLNKPENKNRNGSLGDGADERNKLALTLESFGVKAKVLDVVRGPAVTRYEVQPASGVKVSRIVGLTDDIALALAAKDIRMEAPIPGKSAIGIEVPNSEVSMVTMREVMETPVFQNSPSKLSIAFGRDISGQSIVGNLALMPHLLVAGATGSGKSVCINGIIASLLYKAAPHEVKFLMVDPKMVELNVYNGIPHLLAPVVTDPKRASLALKKIVVEMEKRYELFSKSGTRNIEGYNALMEDNTAAALPYIVVIVDELADLMMVAAGDVEDSIARLAQMARAAGIHLIIATQRPSVDVITGVIKANIPSRIAFGVSSQVDSRTILDSGGAEKLLGRGDMLFLPVGMSKPLRVQGAYLSDKEVETLVNYVRGQAEAEYVEDLVPEVDEEAAAGGMQEVDALFEQAARIVLESKQASATLLQRRMRVGYNRAARIIDQLEERGIIGPYEGSKPREVLMTLEQYQQSS